MTCGVIGGFAMTGSSTRLQALDGATLLRVHGGYSPELFEAMKTAVGMGLTITSTWTSNHGESKPGQSHYKGRAFDSAGSAAQMQRFFQHSLTTNPSELIYRDVNLQDGQRLGEMPGHYNHVHYGK
jgi:hypothetical protein